MLALEYDPELERQAWLEQGVKQGIEQGIEQGREEERFSIVKNLLEAKTPLKYIVAATGWTEEQILKLTGYNFEEEFL